MNVPIAQAIEFLECRGHTDIVSHDDAVQSVYHTESYTTLFTAPSDKWFNKYPTQRYICFMHKPLSQRSKKYLHVEYIDMWRLYVHPCKHMWVPHHERICEEDLPKGIFKEHLPVLLESDAISIWKGFKAGDIIKVVRVHVEDGNIMFRRCDIK